MLLPHDLIKIRPRGVYALTVHVLVLVKHIIKNLDSQMGHSDFEWYLNNGMIDRFMLKDEFAEEFAEMFEG